MSYPQCEDPQCDAVAEWWLWLRTPCCGVSGAYFFCTPHRDELRPRPEFTVPTACVVCGVPCIYTEDSHLVREERL